MSKELKKLSTEELRALYIEGLRELTTAVGDELRTRCADMPVTSAPQPTSSKGNIDSNLANSLLGDASVAYLQTCDEPQSAKQIWHALERAGRKPESANPAQSVTWALRKMLPRDHDLVHVGYGTWHLKSKYKSKAQLERLKLKGAGKGGRTAFEHAARTKDGMLKARAKGQQIGATRKLTPEVVEKIKALLGQPGARVGEVADELGIAKSSIYGNGISKRDCQRAAKLKAESENSGVGHVRLVASNE
jgi:hypothetical protein